VAGAAIAVGGEAKLLKKQIVLGLRKGGKRLHAGEDGRHTIEARAQAAEEVEHEALVGDGGPEGAKSVCHRLHLTAVLVHREIALSKLTKGGLEVQNPSMAVAEELSLKGTPDPVSSVVRYTNDVLKFGREGTRMAGDSGCGGEVGRRGRGDGRGLTGRRGKVRQGRGGAQWGSYRGGDGRRRREGARQRANRGGEARRRGCEARRRSGRRGSGGRRGGESRRRAGRGGEGRHRCGKARRRAGWGENARQGRGECRPVGERKGKGRERVAGEGRGRRSVVHGEAAAAGGEGWGRRRLEGGRNLELWYHVGLDRMLLYKP
jgi:hypothetical protein